MAQELSINYRRDFGRIDRLRVLSLRCQTDAAGAFEQQMTDTMMAFVGGMMVRHVLAGNLTDTAFTNSCTLKIIHKRSGLPDIELVNRTGFIHNNRIEIARLPQPCPIFDRHWIKIENNVSANGVALVELVCAPAGT